MPIKVFSEINESHAATGYQGRTDLPAFHIFSVEDTYPETRQVMPPYTFAFYQVVLLENSNDAKLHSNTREIATLSDSVTFASPEHVLAWVRGEAQRGFILYFKEEFLAHYPTPVQVEFPFFRLTEINMVHTDATGKQGLYDYCRQLLAVFHSDHPYRVQILQSLLLALLFECRRLYDLQQQSLKGVPPQNALVFRFQQFINQHYLTIKTVEAYAQLLNVSPDYLGQTVKEVTGKTPSNLVRERILLEAKKLLIYSELSVAEIADYLGYSEPTHFGRFFRRYTGVSPLAWRQRQHAL
ncbi:MAG: AraC family transcriptional regulator [Anaerolineae bacterium]|nr:AraC family transcriptional regulator [Anaerolineae bacterium]